MKKTEDRRQKTEDRQNSLLIAHCSLLFVLVSYCLLLANDSFAGDYHKSGIPAETTLACAQCHIMHGTQGSVSLIYKIGINTYEKLLRADSVVNLCKYCHEIGRASCRERV